MITKTAHGATSQTTRDNSVDCWSKTTKSKAPNPAKTAPMSAAPSARQVLWVDSGFMVARNDKVEAASVAASHLYSHRCSRVQLGSHVGTQSSSIFPNLNTSLSSSSCLSPLRSDCGVPFQSAVAASGFALDVMSTGTKSFCRPMTRTPGCSKSIPFRSTIWISKPL